MTNLEPTAHYLSADAVVADEEARELCAAPSQWLNEAPVGTHSPILGNTVTLDAYQVAQREAALEAYQHED